MSDPIIPGIDDARAREIAWQMHRCPQLNRAPVLHDLSPLELQACRAAKLLKRFKNRRHDFQISVKGRALWERINTDDRR